MYPSKYPPRLWIACLVLSALLVSALPGRSTPQAQAQTIDPPQLLVGNRLLSDWTVGGPRLFWLTARDCATPAGAAAAITIERVSISGGPARTIFSRNAPRPSGACNPYPLRSNIVADEGYVYWVEDTAMVRLPVEANPDDAPEPWGPRFSGGRVELTRAGEQILAMDAQRCALCVRGTGFELISRADGSSTRTFLPLRFGGSPGFDGTYLYMIDTERDLVRLRLGSAETLAIASEVSAYAAEGQAEQCSGSIPITCTSTSYVFYIQAGRSLERYDNVDGSNRSIYRPEPPTGQVIDLYGLALSTPLPFGVRKSLFFFEKRYKPCKQCQFAASVDLLRRIGLSGGASAELYVRETDTKHFGQDLASDGRNIFWVEQAFDTPDYPGDLKRLSTGAFALPRVNLVATGMEITQGIQRSDNSVPLVQLRPTFVRLFVRAEGANVAGVTAELAVQADGLGTTILRPVNPNSGTRITVRADANRIFTNDSFIFELPPAYTRVPALRLRGVVNPYGVPVEPTLDDNVVVAGPFTFRPTPRLRVIFVEFTYTLNDIIYRPQGTLSNVGWIQRVFPLGASNGAGGWRPGLEYEVWRLTDAGLAARVNRQSPECDGMIRRDANNVVIEDRRDMCASVYVNGLMQDLASRLRVPASTLLYGTIPDTGVQNLLPRGFAPANSRVASGPDALRFNGHYAAHELGHLLGLGHPASAVGQCDLLAGEDPLPPYPLGAIGPSDNSVVGFTRDFIVTVDPNNPLRGQKAVLPAAGYFDMMGYCGPLWISDYNYERLFTRLSSPQTTLAAAPAEAGDWLSVYGVLSPDGEQVAVSQIRRQSGELTPPERVPGDYVLQLHDDAGVQLAAYAFTPGTTNDGEDWGSFGLIVPFVAGAREVQIVRQATDAVLYRKPLTASPPQVGDVQLVGAPSPDGGTITLTWNATAAEGGELTADVVLSRDGGASFIPLLAGLRGRSAAIDTTLVGGGELIFRVIASDGIQSAAADSAPIRLAHQPPRPQILAPADGARLESGQLINLLGEAPDIQDGLVAAGDLAWSTQDGPLGTGSQLAVANLPVGVNLLTLTATNSAGLAASTSITVTVGDDLSEPGPSLEVNPEAISWNIAPGDGDSLSANLDVRNSGGGTLRWRTTDDMPWLTLSATSGEGDQRLTLRADPRGFAANSSARGRILLERLDTSGQPVQTIVVPVTVNVGNPAFGSSAPHIPKQLYLPMIRR